MRLNRLKAYGQGEITLVTLDDTMAARKNL